MTAGSDTQPSTFEPSNSVALSAQKDSKILNVSVYTGRAEITRLFKFNVKAGHNQLTVSELPFVIDQQSFRVEGRGEATIHDVILSEAVAPKATESSPKFEELESEHTTVSKALVRAQKSLKFLEDYLKDISTKSPAVAELPSILARYEAEAEALDSKITHLEGEKARLWKEGEAEKESLLASTKIDEKLKLQAVIGVFAENEGEVEIALIYAVSKVKWSPQYDVRVDMKEKEKPVNLLYKASIGQETGEDWNDVPITLETAAPRFNLRVPSLRPWKLTVPSPPVPPSPRPSLFSATTSAFGTATAASVPTAGGLFGQSTGAATQSTGLFGTVQARDSRAEAEAFSTPPASAEDVIRHRGLEVSSKGNVNATFSVPGLMTIPSSKNQGTHTVTITKLSLGATMEWVAIPKEDTSVHLKTIIKNASEYTLLAGSANIYVDGSFIARSSIAHTNPQESFVCELGVDPSLRVTYHSLTKQALVNRYVSWTTTNLFTQRITIRNVKSVAVDNLKVIDQIPVSENTSVTVKLVAPALDSHIDEKGGGAANPPTNMFAPKPPSPKVEDEEVKVEEGVVATWEKPKGGDVEAARKEGKIGWKCVLAPQQEITLTMQWEVSTPSGTVVVGI